MFSFRKDAPFFVTYLLNLSWFFDVSFCIHRLVHNLAIKCITWLWYDNLRNFGRYKSGLAWFASLMIWNIYFSNHSRLLKTDAVKQPLKYVYFFDYVNGSLEIFFWYKKYA